MPKDDWLKLAILYDKTAKFSPSNNAAIDLFCESAIRNELYPTIIGKDDIDDLHNYNFLLIRDTTHPSHYTYEFATYMEMLGKKVIDSTMAIQKACNKVWQSHSFQENNISHPKTWLINKDTIHTKFTNNITYPCILKIPDSCFSQGVYKADDRSMFMRLVTQINKPNLICQEFMPTTYDWRITVLNHKFLFAIKYYMVKDDWKIIKYDRKGNYTDGHHECVAFKDIPPHILAAASKCDPFIEDGLCGIDIKDINGKAYVIEINDNPSIDAGVEDSLEGQQIYDAIIQSFLM